MTNGIDCLYLLSLQVTTVCSSPLRHLSRDNSILCSLFIPQAFLDSADQWSIRLGSPRASPCQICSPPLESSGVHKIIFSSVTNCKLELEVPKVTTLNTVELLKDFEQ